MNQWSVFFIKGHAPEAAVLLHQGACTKSGHASSSREAVVLDLARRVEAFPDAIQAGDAESAVVEDTEE